MLRCSVLWPQTPAKQSACSSRSTESGFCSPSSCDASVPHPLLDAEQLLHVMAELMRDHVGLREIAGVAAEVLQLLPERQVDVDLFVFGTIERTRRRLRRSAAGIRDIAIQHQLGVPILPSVLGEDLRPGLLRVIEHKADEVHIAVFAGDCWTGPLAGPGSTLA